MLIVLRKLHFFLYLYCMKKSIKIDERLLWEYDVKTFNYDKSYGIVIERVIERGDLEDWKTIVQYYGISKIEEIINYSKQLTFRDKKFAQNFIHSEFLYV